MDWGSPLTFTFMLVVHQLPSSFGSFLVDALERLGDEVQAAGGLEGERVEVPRAERLVDAVAADGADAGLGPGLLVEGERPESLPEVGLERRDARVGAAVDVRRGVRRVDRLAGVRGLGAAVDLGEQRDGLALEGVAGLDQAVVELDHHRVDVDVLAADREAARGQRLAGLVVLDEEDGGGLDPADELLVGDEEVGDAALGLEAADDLLLLADLLLKLLDLVLAAELGVVEEDPARAGEDEDGLEEQAGQGGVVGQRGEIAWRVVDR